MRVVPPEKKGTQLSNRIIQRNANHPNGHPNGQAFGLRLFRVIYFSFLYKTQSDFWIVPDHISSCEYFPIIAAGAN